MISPQLRAEIRRLFYAEHFKVGTIASHLDVHPDTVKRAIWRDRFGPTSRVRGSALEPYLELVERTLKQYPKLRATRIHEMIVERGYQGSVAQTRRLVRRLRPRPVAEAYLRLRTLPAEEAQVDWGHFGHVQVGRAKRPLSAFVMVLSWSRAVHALFTLDQTMESFLRGHVEAFSHFQGVPRRLLYDNLKSVVLERWGDVIHFHPRILEFAAHYHFEPKPVAIARGNEKGRVERQIRFLRERFFAARQFRDVDDLNAQFRQWRDRWAHERPCPTETDTTVGEAFEQERGRLMPLPQHPFDTAALHTVTSGKTPYVRFDLNDYSIPHTEVRKPLTLVATDKQIRILDGNTEVARHDRSYDRHARVETPEHIDELVARKRRARGKRSTDRLMQVAPRVQELLQQAIDRGCNLGNTVSQLARLLDEYGHEHFAAAVDAAIDGGTPTPASVAHVLEQHRRKNNLPPPLPVRLPERPGIREITITKHNLEDYDALSQGTNNAPDEPNDNATI